MAERRLAVAECRAMERALSTGSTRQMSIAMEMGSRSSWTMWKRIRSRCFAIGTLLAPIDDAFGVGSRRCPHYRRRRHHHHSHNCFVTFERDSLADWLTENRGKIMVSLDARECRRKRFFAAQNIPDSVAIANAKFDAGCVHSMRNVGKFLNRGKNVTEIPMK